MPKPKSDPSFEKDLEQLEQIVEALETGGLSLDDALKQFELGIKLSRRCESALTAAEKKIEILTRNADGEIEGKPFGDEASDDEGPPPAPNDDADDAELLF